MYGADAGGRSWCTYGVLPAALSILAELPDDDITLTLGDKNVIELRCGRIETKLFSMSPDEFPPIRSFDGIQPLVFEQSTLKNLFTKTSFAIRTDQARYNLTGLLLEFTGVDSHGGGDGWPADEPGGGEGCDSDGCRVQGDQTLSEDDYESERLLGEDTTVDVLIDESQASFVFDHVRLVTALIEGNFPNYDMVVPKKHDKEAVMDCAKFELLKPFAVLVR